MKTIKLIIAAVLVMAGMSVSAQWTDNGTYSTTTDKIVLGTASSAPSDLFSVQGTSNFTNTMKITRLKALGADGEFKFGWGAINGADGIMYGKTHATYPGQFKIMYGGAPSIGNFSVMFYDGSTYYTNLLINSDGNVGIGTVTPSSKLHVDGIITATSLVSTGSLSCTDISANGKITTKEVEVTLTAFPDYVFDNDYKLRTLSEVEEFIKENKHLPGIPSADEVVNNGLSLGEMNVKLMEKVEELTLYIIQLQKEVDALKEIK